MATAQPALRALSNLLRNAAVDRALPLLRSLARAAADTVFPPACRQFTDAMGSLCAACWAAETSANAERRTGGSVHRREVLGTVSYFCHDRFNRNRARFHAALVLRSGATLKLASVFALTSSSVAPSASSMRVMPPPPCLSIVKTARSVITRSMTAVPVSGKVQ